MLPRSGSRALVLVGIFIVVAIAIAGVTARSDPPRLDPSPPPSDVDWERPSSGRLLGNAEVREQLGPEWRDARLSLVRFADLAEPYRATDRPVAPDRLLWLVVRESRDGWALRVYDAATGVRLTTLDGRGALPR